MFGMPSPAPFSHPRKRIPIPLLILLALCVSANPLFAEENQLIMAVNAPRGEAVALARFGELARALGQGAAKTVRIAPLKVADLVGQSVALKAELVVANPIQAVHLHHVYGHYPLLTVNGPAGPRFGGVVFSRKYSSIRSIPDIQGKRVASLDPSSAGAYVFPVHHLLVNGLNVAKHAASHTYMTKQDDVVLAVKTGRADVGLVRTGILESLEEEGKIQLADFHIIDQRHSEGFPFIHSTPLLPEWYVMAAAHLPEPLRDHIRSLLLNLPPDSPALHVAEIRGFVPPLPMHDLVDALRTLKAPPFN